MAIPLIMTVLGPDRPGLVDVVATAVAEHGGNWLDSRMCHLGGHFAGIVRVEVPGDREHALRQQIQTLALRGLQVTIARDDGEGATSAARRTMVLDLVGNDRPGIIQQISHTLASHGVNVEELHTERTSAPWSGEPLFEARLRIEIPESCTVARLRADLEKIAGELMVDFTLGLKA